MNNGTYWNGRFSLIGLVRRCCCFHLQRSSCSLTSQPVAPFQCPNPAAVQETLAALSLGECLGGISSGGLAHWDGVGGTVVATGCYQGVGMHFAGKAGRRKSCMEHVEISCYMSRWNWSSHQYHA